MPLKASWGSARSASELFEGRDFDYGERRFITLGMLHGEVVVIATVEKDEEIRVTSMRKAERHEDEIYRTNI